MKTLEHDTSLAATPSRTAHPLKWALLASALVASSVFAAPARAADGEVGPPVLVTGTRLLTTNEINYVNTLHTQLDRTKRYPTSREASISHPSGATTVWIDLARDGHVVGHGIQDTSYSQILDRMATTLVGRANYPVFPADSWTNGPTHRFAVTYRFLKETEASEPQVAVAISAR